MKFCPRTLTLLPFQFPFSLSLSFIHSFSLSLSDSRPLSILLSPSFSSSFPTQQPSSLLIYFLLPSHEMTRSLGRLHITIFSSLSFINFPNWPFLFPFNSLMSSALSLFTLLLFSLSFVSYHLPSCHMKSSSSAFSFLSFDSLYSSLDEEDNWARRKAKDDCRVE